MLVNASHKQAVKAALGIMVASRGHNASDSAVAIHDAVEEIGLQIGDMDDLYSKLLYAEAIAVKGEHSSNRKWSSYPSDVQRLARILAKRAEQEIQHLLQ